MYKFKRMSSRLLWRKIGTLHMYTQDAGSGMIIGDRPRAVVSGSLTGNVVTVLVERGPIEGATYTLEAGVSRAPIEPTCPL